MLWPWYPEREHLPLNSDFVVSWPSDFWPHLKMVGSYIETLGYRIAGKWHITQNPETRQIYSLGTKRSFIVPVYLYAHTLPNRTLNHYFLVLLPWRKPAISLLCLWQWIHSHIQSWQLIYDSFILLLCFALYVNLSHPSYCRLWQV